MTFFLFSTSEPNSKESGRENQRSEAGEAGNPSQKAVAGNEVEGEKGQGANSEKAETETAAETDTEKKKTIVTGKQIGRAHV